MNDNELLRYSRQIMLPDIEIEGQEKLLSSRVAIVGLGGLGCPVALYLTAAGVGQLVLIDFDAVEVSNLQRQIAHEDASVGDPKVTSASRTISRLNPKTVVTTIDERVSLERLCEIADSVDVLVDGSDNFATRYDVNNASIATGTPLVSGAAIRMEGQILVTDPRDPNSPCYRCLYRDGVSEPLNCAENGVLAPLVGVIGAMQAVETVKLICELPSTSIGWVLYFDAKRMDWRKLKLRKNLECPDCSD